jgi:hypothetical protein
MHSMPTLSAATSLPIDDTARPAGSATLLHSDYARGQRRSADEIVAVGDFATGQRGSLPTAIVGTFATGMRTASVSAAIGDFATGMRTVRGPRVIVHDSVDVPIAVSLAA